MLLNNYYNTNNQNKLNKKNQTINIINSKEKEINNDKLNYKDILLKSTTSKTASNNPIIKHKLEIKNKNKRIDLSDTSSSTTLNSNIIEQNEIMQSEQSLKTNDFFKNLTHLAGMSSQSSYSINEAPIANCEITTSPTNTIENQKHPKGAVSVPIKIEREKTFHCDTSDYNFRQRYSAADIVSFNIPPSNNNNNNNSKDNDDYDDEDDDEASSSVLLSTFPSKPLKSNNNNLINKCSNLKKKNSTRSKQNEKVKFSDIELRHLIKDNNNNLNKDQYTLKQSISSSELKNLKKKNHLMKHSNTLNVLDMNKLCGNNLPRRILRNIDKYNDYDDFELSEEEEEDYNNDDEEDDLEDYYYFDEKENNLKPLSRNSRLAKQIYVDRCGNYYYNYCLKPVSSHHLGPPLGPPPLPRFYKNRRIESSESDFEISNSSFKKFRNERMFNYYLSNKNRKNNRYSNHRASSNQRYYRHHNNNHFDDYNKEEAASMRLNKLKLKMHKSNDELQNFELKERDNHKKSTLNEDKKHKTYTPPPPPLTLPALPSLSGHETSVMPTPQLIINDNNNNSQSKSNTKQIEAATLAKQAIEMQNLNKIKQQIINPVSPIDTMPSTTPSTTTKSSSNYVKPMSKGQLNRIVAFKDSNSVYSNKFQDLIAENASFIDSPIHSLMSHHVNQRLLKQQHQQNHKNTDSNLTRIDEINVSAHLLHPKIVDNEGKQQILKVNENDLIKIELKDDLIQTEQTTRFQDSQVYTYEYDEEKPIDTMLSSSLPPIIDPKIVQIAKKLNFQNNVIFYAILMTSLIIYSSIYLLELINCLVRVDNTNLMIFKLSAFISCFVYVILISFKSDQTDKYYYNIFYSGSNKIVSIDNNNNNNNNDDSQTQVNNTLIQTTSTSSKQSVKIKSNFYMILISLLLVYFWILNTYLFSYLFSTPESIGSIYFDFNQSKWIESITETISAIIGGFGIFLFAKNVILYLYEFNLILELQEKNKKNEKQPKSGLDMILANIEKKASSLNALKKVILKYFIVLQSHWILTISFFVYTVYIMGESSVNSVLSLICLESVNTTKFKLCPTQLMTNEFFSWKNEISYRKSGQPNSQSSYYLVSLQKLFQYQSRRRNHLGCRKKPLRRWLLGHSFCFWKILVKATRQVLDLTR